MSAQHEVTSDLPSEAAAIQGDQLGASHAALNTDPRWWQSVRLRFSVLLALALLPWLILTALEAFESLDQTRVSRAILADTVASNTVAEVGRTLEAGRLALEAVPQIIDDMGCEAGTSQILDRLSVYSALIVKDMDDQVICQNPGSLPSLVLFSPDPLSQQQPFRIERGWLGDGDMGEDVVVLQSLQPSKGKTYTLVLPRTLGIRDVLNAVLGTGSEVALTKANGQAIIGENASPVRLQFFQEQMVTDDISLIDYEGTAGENRRVAIRFFRYLDLYVAVARNARPPSARDLINPYTSVLMPITAWLVGFALIWFGTQTMLLTPIRKVRRSARLFARGNMDSRVRLSNAAAAEVQGLAGSFNSMAMQLQERERRIADNIDEKDTLMREIHHRVKNNLQIIISLLNMQERKADSQEAIEAISATRTRINAIAIVHRGLYESKDLRAIDVEPFLSRLINTVGESLDLDEAGVGLSQSVASARLSADDAIPIALFIVEAITNAATHGVDRGGHIHVDAKTIEQTGALQIDVRDDGRGVGDPESMRGIGTRLMKGFARQLSGTLTYHDNSPGLTARLSLPPRELSDQPFQVSRKQK